MRMLGKGIVVGTPVGQISATVKTANFVTRSCAKTQWKISLWKWISESFMLSKLYGTKWINYLVVSKQTYSLEKTLRFPNPCSKIQLDTELLDWLSRFCR